MIGDDEAGTVPGGAVVAGVVAGDVVAVVVVAVEVVDGAVASALGSSVGAGVAGIDDSPSSDDEHARAIEIEPTTTARRRVWRAAMAGTVDRQAC